MLLKAWAAGGFYSIWMGNAFKRVGDQCFKTKGCLTRLIDGWGGPPGAQGRRPTVLIDFHQWTKILTLQKSNIFNFYDF